MSNRPAEVKSHGLSPVPVEAIAPDTLEHCLAGFGLPILPKADVDAYKAKKLEALRQPELARELHRLHTLSSNMEDWGFWSKVVGGCGAFGALVSLNWALGGVSLAVFLAGFALTRYGSVFENRYRALLSTAKNYRPFAQWNRTSWLGFENKTDRLPIPADILNRVEYIGQVLPDATVQVDWLYLDPFAVVERGKEEAYVGFWDEDFTV